MKTINLALTGLALVAAAPAVATPITYSVTGTDSTGVNFSITGTGDTASVFGFFGDVAAVPTVALTSNTITSGANSGSILGSLYFFNNLSFSTAGFNLGLDGDLLDFSSATFGPYDAVSAVGPVSVSPVYGDSIATSFGSINLGNASNLRFQAVLQGSVPEPATWSMMLLGFGGMGVALRRRRKTAQLA